MTITSNKQDLVEFGKWYRNTIVSKSLAIHEPIEIMVEKFYQERSKTVNR